MFQQTQDSVVDQVRRRLLAGDDEQLKESQDVLRGQLFAVDFGASRRVSKSSAGMSPLFDGLREPRVHFARNGGEFAQRASSASASPERL